MPLRFEIKKEFSCSCDRVKSVDFHPTEPILIQSLYTGFIQIWNYRTNSLEKTFEVTQSANVPVRGVKFIVRKQWFVCGSDDMVIRVFDYNTLRKIKQWEAHSDYIRYVDVHPTLPLIFSTSDDLTIKSWNWENDFALEKTYEGHLHYVMQMAISPKDSNVFATASLDGKIKIWNVNSKDANLTLSGHSKGVNCVAFFNDDHKNFIVSGGDDFEVKIWDYSSKQCVKTLKGHTENISAVAVHPLLPLIFSNSEDGTIRVWHSRTFRLETTLDYSLDRSWALSVHKKTNAICAGFDFGSIVIRVGDEQPVVSMDSSGNLIWFNDYAILSANVKRIGEKEFEENGLMEKIDLKISELGNCEIYPKSIMHSPNGRLINITGDNQYTVNTSRKMNSVAFGSAKDFVWSYDSKVYAVRDTNEIKIFFEHKEKKSFKPHFAVENIFGGALIALQSSNFVEFCEWPSLKFVKRFDFCPKNVIWSENGSRVALVGHDKTLLLRVVYSKDKKLNLVEENDNINETINSAIFAGDFCFVYVNQFNCLKYQLVSKRFSQNLKEENLVKREKSSLIKLKQMENFANLVKYLPKEEKVYLMDKEKNVFSVVLKTEILLFEMAIINDNLESSRQIFNKMDKNLMKKGKMADEMADFLQIMNLPKFALEIAVDENRVFDLALQIGDFELAQKTAIQINAKANWMKLAETALKNAEFDLAIESAKKAQNFELLLLIHTALNNKTDLENLAKSAKSKNNTVFLCLLKLGRFSECADLLLKDNKFGEAALFSKNFVPKKCEEIVKKWNEASLSNLEFLGVSQEIELKVENSEKK